MNISKQEQRVLHVLAQGGRIVHRRDDTGRITDVDCFTRDGHVLADCTLALFRRLKRRGLIASRNAGPYRVTRLGIVSVGLTIEEVLRRLAEIPEAIRAIDKDQGGGHANHQFFWKILTPDAPDGPSGDLKAAIETEWGSVDAFKAAFEAAGAALFGSGWVFLVARPKQNFKLEILALPNQDSLLIQPEPAPGLLACDVWEHAYYLKYNNRRADWLKAWWGVVHWDYVGERLAGIHAGKKQL